MILELGSNPRPHEWMTQAVTTELHARHLSVGALDIGASRPGRGVTPPIICKIRAKCAKKIGQRGGSQGKKKKEKKREGKRKEKRRKEKKGKNEKKILTKNTTFQIRV